jgi:O-antigen ligase
MDGASCAVESTVTGKSEEAEYNISWRIVTLQAALLGSTAVSPVATDIVCVILALLALGGPLASLQSLSLAVVIRSGNPELVHYGVAANALLFAIPLIASLRLLPLIRLTDIRIVGPLWMFCAVAVACSLVASPAPVVSVFKASSLAVIAGSVLVANLRLSQSEVGALGRWLRTLAVLVAAASLATLSKPAIAFLSDSNELLRGVLKHPQLLGVFLAPLCAAYLSKWLFKRRHIDSPTYVINAILITCIILTLSRMAAIAAVLGAVGSFVGGRSASGQSAGSGARRLFGISVILVVSLVAVAMTSATVSRALTGYVMKRDHQDLSSAFLESRGNGMISELRNFVASPIIGNGFGVYADGSFPVGVTKYYGIPISAPVEKGILPAAVLEETGVVGFLFFAFLIYSLVRGVWNSTERPIMAMLFACLFSNLGEATLFSPGAVGLYMWLVIGWCLRTAASGSALPTEPTPQHKSGGLIRKFYANLLD